MVRQTYTYTRPDSSIKWWQDWGADTDNQEVITLYNYQNNFFNNNVNTAAGERWSIAQTDDLNIVFTIELSQERLNEIEGLFVQDFDLIMLRTLNDTYNSMNGITLTVNTVDI